MARSRTDPAVEARRFRKLSGAAAVAVQTKGLGGGRGFCTTQLRDARGLAWNCDQRRRGNTHKRPRRVVRGASSAGASSAGADERGDRALSTGTRPKRGQTPSEAQSFRDVLRRVITNDTTLGRAQGRIISLADYAPDAKKPNVRALVDALCESLVVEVVPESHRSGRAFSTVVQYRRLVHMNSFT